MGRRGPKPKTAEQLRIQGSHAPKQSRFVPHAAGVPECPEQLTDAAKSYWWKIIAPLRDGGWVGELDTQALARYCVLLARQDECERMITQQGLVVEYPNGQTGRSHYLTIAHENARLLVQLEKELGLTPYARRSLTPVTKEKVDEPAAKYFG